MDDIIIKKAYDFDDVLIPPRHSNIVSRDSVDISVMLSNTLTLKFPLIASPMVGVVDGNFASQLSKLGGMAIFHRFYKSREYLFSDIETNIDEKCDIYGISMKIDEKNYEEYFDRVHPNLVLIDTANGYSMRLLRYCEKIKNYLTKNELCDIILMAGNVATAEGCVDLYNSGCDIIRVGIGGGSSCTTRNQTGIGIPNITALMDCDRANRDYKIVIDGGIKNSGDLVKSIVAGADFGMSGKLFAETYESPNEGILYGMASRTHMENTKANIKSVEGTDTIITKKYSLAQFVREFGYGIKSAGTYLDAKNLQEIYFHGSFIEVGYSAIKKGI